MENIQFCSEATDKQAEEFTCTNNAATNEVLYRLFQKDIKDRVKLPPTQSCLSKHTNAPTTRAMSPDVTVFIFMSTLLTKINTTLF